MLDLKKIQTKRSKSRTPAPGTYDSTVVSVAEPEGYAQGTAVKIKYLLTNAQGREFSHEELFIIGGEFIPERTTEFDDYLVHNGVGSYDEFVGCHEKLKIYRNGIYANIEDRKFISKPTEDGGASNVSGGQ